MTSTQLKNRSWMKEEKSANVNIRIEPSLRDALLETAMAQNHSMATYAWQLVVNDLEKGGRIRARPWPEENRSVNLNFKMEPTLRKAMRQRADGLDLTLSEYLRYLMIGVVQKPKTGRSR